MLCWESEGNARYSGGQVDWLKRMRKDLEAFRITINEKEGPEASAKQVGVSCKRIDEGVVRFMHGWLKKKGETSKRHVD